MPGPGRSGPSLLYEVPVTLPASAHPRGMPRGISASYLQGVALMRWTEPPEHGALPPRTLSPLWLRM